jgi:hypothetical protein
MSTKKRHQTAAKRDRERAVELKRTLKRQKKQEAAAAAREGEGEGEATFDSGVDIEPALPDDSDGTPRETEAVREIDVDR